MPLRISTPERRIDFEGSFFACHSLALVNRELSLALIERGGYDLAVRHLGPTDDAMSPSPRLAPLTSRAGRSLADPVLTIRHFWPPDLSRPRSEKLVLIQPWEFGSLPVAWRDGVLQNVDEVWAPSRYVRDIYLRAGVPSDRVAVVPNGVRTDLYRPGAEPLALPTEKSFKFLFVGGTIARKGIDVLLDAYTRTFSSQDDVALVIKDFGAGSFYKGQTAETLISALQAKPGGPEIVLLTDDLPEESMPSLYAACDCLVHPYRGEGFGLPIAEAMACEKPVIVTGSGAALDFVNDETGYLVRATPVQMAERRIGDLETVDLPFWAEPDREILSETMRRVIANPAEAAERAARAREHIAKNWTWERAAEVAAERLNELLDRPSRVSGPSVSAAQSYEAAKQAALDSVRSGNFAAAIERIRSLLVERPGDADCANALAVALFRTGELREAREILETGIRSNANPRDFHHNLAFLLLESGEPGDALEHAAAAFAMTPEDQNVRRTLERARQAVMKEARKLRKGQGGSQKQARRNERYRALIESVDRVSALLEGKKSQLRIAERRAGLSIVMIAKNEERFLRECLDSVKDIADEIVLVDTGSTDGTVAIAEEFGAKVVRRQWNDDFSEARNVSLDHATGEWALWLDADERLPAGEGAKLRELIASAPQNVGGYMVNIRNYMQLDETADVCWHRACRLFRLVPGVRFSGRIHEQNARQLQAAGYLLNVCKLTIDHWGYAAAVMSERDKHARFIRMLTREVEENPDDQYHGFHLFNLGNAYFTTGDMAEAAKWLEEAAERPDPTEEYTAMLFIELATAQYTLGRAADSHSTCDRAEALGIRHPGFDFARGHASLHQRDYLAAERHFQRSVEGGRDAVLAHVGDAGAYTYKARYGLALACMGQDRYADCERWCREALGEKPDFLDARYLLANALRRQARHAEAAAEYRAVLDRAPDHPLAVVEGALSMLAAGDFERALPALRRACQLAPDNVELLAARADAADRSGLSEEARDAYLVATRLAPMSAELRVNLARAHAATGDNAAAADCLNEAIRLDPEYANSYFNAGDLLYSLGQYALAAEALQQGLSKQPGHAPGFFVLGNCYFQTEDYAAAAVCFEQAIVREPGYREALSNLELTRERLASKAA